MVNENPATGGWPDANRVRLCLISSPFGWLFGAKRRYFIDLSLKIPGLEPAAPNAKSRPGGEQDEKRQYISHRLEG